MSNEVYTAKGKIVLPVYRWCLWICLNVTKFWAT